MVSPFDQVTSAINRVQREVVLARFLGKLAVDQGIAEVRQRIEAIRADVVEPAPSAAEPAGTPAVPPGPTTMPTGASDELALADYDSLPASAIVAKLDGLEPDELDAIETYELHQRGRRTILGRIRQLREDTT
ncbi:MAG TPA: hypothetical protein VK853_09775 [Ilumatobacteraceae bacterium]|nr:hypothetical protein [Ilumatobacteraceae bacterium]